MAVTRCLARRLKKFRAEPQRSALLSWESDAVKRARSDCHRPVLTWITATAGNKGTRLINRLTPKDPYSWVKRNQLDATYFIILFNAQHVSDVNTSIFRSLRLIRSYFMGCICEKYRVYCVACWRHYHNMLHNTLNHHKTPCQPYYRNTLSNTHQDQQRPNK